MLSTSPPRDDLYLRPDALPTSVGFDNDGSDSIDETVSYESEVYIVTGERREIVSKTTVTLMTLKMVEG